MIFIILEKKFNVINILEIVEEDIEKKVQRGNGNYERVFVYIG